MFQSIRDKWQRLGDPPENLPPEDYRFIVFSNYTFLTAGLFHLLYIPFFALLGIPVLALYNVCSAVIWLVAIRGNQAGQRIFPYALATLEVGVHAVLCVALIGWETGFQYYVLVVPLAIFLSPWPPRLKIASTSVVALFFALLELYGRLYPPLQPLGPTLAAALHFGNALGIFMTLAIFSFNYRRVVLRIEARLEEARRRAAEALETRNTVLNHLTDELNEAADYVRSVLPDPLTRGPVRTDWRYLPSAGLGGDAFGYHWIDPGHFAVYLLDVSGHGVGAALLSVSIMNVLRAGTLTGIDLRAPEQVLDALNQAFPAERNRDMYFTIWYGVYQPAGRTLAFAGGGHPPALMWSNPAAAEPRLEPLTTANPIVGGLATATYRARRLTLEGPSRIYLYSDGIYELPHPDGGTCRVADFANLVQELNHRGDGNLDRVVAAVREAHPGVRFSDDVTLLQMDFN
jgi:sigma-B regulation protein RsbU (phosphoserine phosphatase)